MTTATPPINPIELVPGPGWGDGSHPTTRLCLQAIAHFARGLPAALDFGSGSGILSIAMAKRGARVDAVEIDPEANLHAFRNARLNGVADRIRFHESLDGLNEHYPLIVANILRPVLMEFADALVSRLERPSGILVLSGLVSTDVPELAVRYSSLTGQTAQVFSQGEWRLLAWQAS